MSRRLLSTTPPGSAPRQPYLTVRALDSTGSIVDGPGVRSVLYLQGCERHCAGCHNPETWDPAAGERVLVTDLVAELRRTVTNRKLTISGGEPLLQVQALVELLRAIQDFHIVLYTGYELADVPAEVLSLLDHVKVGAYSHEVRCTTRPYVGSNNQRMVQLREGR